MNQLLSLQISLGLGHTLKKLFPRCSKLNNDYQVVIHGTCEHYLTFKSIVSGTSPVPQWARIQAPSAGVLGLIPSQETRSHILQLRVSAKHGHCILEPRDLLQVFACKGEKKRHSSVEPLSFAFLSGPYESGGQNCQMLAISDGSTQYIGKRRSGKLFPKGPHSQHFRPFQGK